MPFIRRGCGKSPAPIPDSVPNEEASGSGPLVNDLIASMISLLQGQEARLGERLSRLELRMDQDHPIATTVVASGATNAAAAMPACVQGRLISDFHKLDPPIYTGKSDTEEIDLWILKMNKLFITIECSVDQMQILAPLQLDGPAYLWWELESQRLQILFSWESFQEWLRSKFLPSIIWAGLRDVFLHLEQGSMTVDAYEKEFIRLSQYASGVISTEAYKITCFLKGLRFNIRSYVVARDLHFYANVMETALQVERSELAREAYQGKKKAKEEGITISPGGSKYLKEKR